MYPSPVFAWTDRAEQLAFIAERAFATLVAVHEGAVRIAQAPVLVDGERLLLHLSRANVLARALPLRVTAVVHGPDAYVSPDWYASEQQVPTWNYVSVELEGELAATDEATLRAILERQSAAFEARLAGKPPWTMAKLTEATLVAKLKGIVGATLSIDALRGTRKLSQNKAAEDVAGVIAALSSSGHADDRALAAWMPAGKVPRRDSSPQ